MKEAENIPDTGQAFQSVKQLLLLCPGWSHAGLVGEDCGNAGFQRHSPNYFRHIHPSLPALRVCRTVDPFLI